MTEAPMRATVSQKAALFGPSGDVLLVRDGTDPWEFPGGRVEVDEDAEPALRREIREETGLEVDVGWPVLADAWTDDDGRGRFAVVYRCETDRRAVSLGREHTDHAWVAPAAAREAYLANPRQRTAVERAETRS